MHRLLISSASLLLVGALIFAFSDILRGLNYIELTRSLRRLPTSAVFFSVLATSVSFAALVGREVTALRYIGACVPLAALTIAGFAGSALGNAVGFGVLTAAAVRYRIYESVGLKAYDIVRLVGFVVAGSTIGLTATGGLASLVEANEIATLVGLPALLIRCAGAAVLVGVGALLALRRPAGFHFAGLSVVGPSRSLMSLQVLLTAARVLGAAVALWVLLPPSSISFFTFVGLFSAATALGTLSHVPGGAGVFDVIILWALKGQASSASLIAALIAYRGVYYLLPLILSAIAFAYFEVAAAFGEHEARRDEKLARAAARLAPIFIGVIAFGTGVMLLVSGATPTFGYKLTQLSQHVPLWAVEISSFLGSVLGVVFLFVAKGLLDRRDGAWRLALALSLSSLVFSVFKGLAFGEATFLLFFSALLLATRQQFDRPTSMIDQPFTWSWFAAVGAILAALFGILWLAFDEIQSGLGGLWWQFEFDAQAPRALRAVLGALVVAVALASRQLLRPPTGLAHRPTLNELERASAIINGHPRGDALMAFMGDKSLMFSSSERAFLMFGKRGRSWIALFDPIGPREDWADLIDRFIAISREHGGRASFYHVRPESLPSYLDAGFTAIKLGEEAIVDLAAFTLAGGAAAHLRYALKRGERDGLAFELLTPEQAFSRFDDLAEISAHWLDARRSEEKGFSVSAFEPTYVLKQHVGLLRRNGAPVAFASVMTTGSGSEATLGLMRSSVPNTPVAMEFLLTRLIIALRDMGYARLSLGVAPLSGLRPAPLSARWHQLAALIWRHGDRFYNFQGLRTFKNKFNPEWEPRYFVASGTLGPFVALADAVVLISAGPFRSRENVDV